MPPKGKKNEPNKKTVDKQKQKVIEDKTFGLKNKKGGKQQKFIKMVQTQVTQGNQKARQVEQQKEKERQAVKDSKKDKQQELNMLFRPVDQKVGKGVDPKSVLCAFFKQGSCSKGDKCKFSHDLNIGRKGEKRSVYDDAKGEEQDNMENWDEAKLEEVVNKKHGQKNKSMPATAIICKYFLDAVENNKYGWFWSCPNGEGCHYRHALPPGFVLKKDQKKAEKVEEISLEELIEKERAALSSKNLTPVTLASFQEWKERKRKEKIKKAKAASDKKKADFKAGKTLGISGREMFEFNPDLVQGDDDEAEDIQYQREEDNDGEQEYDGPIHEIDLNALASAAREKDGSGTKRTDNPSVQDGASAANATENSGEDGKLDEAAALPNPAAETDAAISAAMAATVNGEVELAQDTPIDENLFDGEDLDLIEEELDTLELDD